MAEAAHLQYVLSVLNHAGVIGVNWQGVAEDNGVGYARNCLQKFKDTVHKYGYVFQNNKLIKSEDAGTDQPATPTARKATRKATPKTKVTKATTPRKPVAKKRKVEESEDSDEDKPKQDGDQVEN